MDLLRASTPLGVHVLSRIQNQPRSDGTRRSRNQIRTGYRSFDPIPTAQDLEKPHTTSGKMRCAQARTVEGGCCRADPLEILSHPKRCLMIKNEAHEEALDLSLGRWFTVPVQIRALEQVEFAAFVMSRKGRAEFRIGSIRRRPISDDLPRFLRHAVTRSFLTRQDSPRSCFVLLCIE